MTNDERDKMIMEMHGDIKTLLKSDEDVRRTLYGNGKPEICNDVQILQTNQENCRRSRAANYALFIALLTGPISALLTYWLTK